MSAAARRTLAVALIVGAAVLAVVALLLWKQASDDADADALANDYAEASGADPFLDEDPDRTPALVAGGVAAVLFIAGVIVIAAAPSPAEVDEG